MLRDRNDVKQVAEFLDSMPVEGDRAAHDEAVMTIHKQAERAANLAHNKQGWLLKHIPWSPRSYWDMLFNLIGADNFIIISFTGKFVDLMKEHRGSLLVSPNGVERLMTYAEEKKGSEETGPKCTGP
jgi:hypothetical protein